MTLTLTDHTNLLWLITFTQILIWMWMPALRWSIAQTIYQFFVCLIDKCQDVREHSIFVIKATLMWTSIFGDVNAVDWINVCDKSNDIHEEEANCISVLKQIADKHAPVKKHLKIKGVNWPNHGLLEVYWLQLNTSGSYTNHTSSVEILIKSENVSFMLIHLTESKIRLRMITTASDSNSTKMVLRTPGSS